VATKKKPFEQYSNQLADGRRVVMVVVYEPRPATLWIAATSKREALQRARDFGASEPHVVSHLRPLGAEVDAAASDADGGVFIRSVNEVHRVDPLALRELRGYLEGTSRAF
jgi:hypothetical protein